MDIGALLKERRERRKETLEEVAFRAGTDPGNLSRIERNRQDLSVNRLIKLCEALEISLSEFFAELEKRAGGNRLSDPAAAFDKETRWLLKTIKTVPPTRRRLILEVTETIAKSGRLA